MRKKSDFTSMKIVTATLIAICLLSSKNGIAQVEKKIKFPDRIIGLNTGISQHLSQSLGGVYLGLDHEIKIAKKISFHNNFSLTFHKGRDATQSGILSNATTITTVPPDFKSLPLKFFTAGIQTYAAASTSFFSGKMRIGAGPLLRYQTTTKPEKYEYTATTRPTTSGGVFLYRAYYVINSIRPHTFAAGGILFMDVKLFKIKTIETKGNVLYQFDSQGDRLFSAGIKLTKPYKKTS